MENINYDKFFLDWDEIFNWNCVSLDMKCKEFAFYGSVLLKKIFKEHNIKASVQVKKYFLDILIYKNTILYKLNMVI